MLPFALLFGSSYLGTVILTSMFCFERYGSQVKGRVFGLLFLIHQAGAFLSVQLGARSFEATGSYVQTIVALGVVTGFAAVCAWLGLRGVASVPPALHVAASARR